MAYFYFIWVLSKSKGFEIKVKNELGCHDASTDQSIVLVDPNKTALIYHTKIRHRRTGRRTNFVCVGLTHNQWKRAYFGRVEQPFGFH